jgi:hypothetical protein
MAIQQSRALKSTNVTDEYQVSIRKTTHVLTSKEIELNRLRREMEDETQAVEMKVYNNPDFPKFANG